MYVHTHTARLMDKLEETVNESSSWDWFPQGLNKLAKPTAKVGFLTAKCPIGAPLLFSAKFALPQEPC